MVPLLSSLLVPVNVDGEGRLRLQHLICLGTVFVLREGGISPIKTCLQSGVCFGI